MGGERWLARMTDKARLKAAGLGDYIYPCPSDRQLLSRLGLTSAAFLSIVRQAQTDDEVLAVLKGQGAL